MRHYEIVAVIHPDQSDQVSGMIDRYKSIVTENGGQVHHVEDWGRMQLAYPLMKKLYKAHYFLMNVECSMETLSKLEENFKFNDAVLRTLVVRRNKKITSNSPMMAALNRGGATDKKEKAST